MRAIRISALIAALLSLSTGANAQTHVYNLNGSLADQFGGPSLSANGGLLSASGYTFGANQGLTLSNVFAQGGSYSLVVHSRFDDAGGWRKIVDFWDLQSDHGYYAYFGAPDFDPYNYQFGTEYLPGLMATSVITRDATDETLKVYVNGGLRYLITDGGKYSDFAGANGIARFFEDDAVTNGTESTSGFVDYIATYNTVLSDQEVADISNSFVAPEPGSLALLFTGLGAIALLRRRRTR